MISVYFQYIVFTHLCLHNSVKTTILYTHVSNVGAVILSTTERNACYVDTLVAIINRSKTRILE